MSTKIEWENQQPPANSTDVKKVEEILGVKLPADYVKCAMRNHGGQPTPDCLIVDGDERVFNSLFALSNPEGEDDVETLLEAYELVRDRLPDKVIPFGDDPAGNLFCFDYRRGSAPTIAFWDHEVAAEAPDKSLTYIEENFTKFINMLYDPDNEEDL
jgi:hypothetical protein